MTEQEHRPGGRQDSREQTGRFSFEATAQRLGVPSGLWEQPAVRQFLTTVNHIDNLALDLTLAGSQSNEQAANGTPSLAERYQAAGRLLDIVSIILTDGFNNAPPIASTPEQRDELRQQAEAAFQQYGLGVIDTKRRSSTTSRTADRWQGVPMYSEVITKRGKQGTDKI